MNVNGIKLPFLDVVFEDFEFISILGERPDVVCGCFHSLRTGQTTRLWRDQLNDQLPYENEWTLVVSFVFNAEGTCHLSLGQPLPKNVLDLSHEFKRHVNGKGIPRKNQGLIGALQYFGLDTIAPKRKDVMRERIMKGWPFTSEERGQILDYCTEDVEMLRQLFLAMLPRIDFPLGLFHGEFVAALARSEHTGVPIDTEVYPQLADQKTWMEIRDSMVPLVDVHGVYVRNNLVGWSFNLACFEEFCVAEGIDWPRTENGKLDLRRKTFDSMGKAYPEQIEPLRQLRYIRDKLRKIQLSVGHDGRNRTVLWPFSSKTSRTQPKAKHWIFSPSVWLRFLIKPEPGTALAYIDYSSMEFGAAAKLSDKHVPFDNNPMLNAYQTGDPYLKFGKTVDQIPPDASRKTPGVDAKRDQLKVMCLGTQYGMQALTLSTRLGVTYLEAYEMLQLHRGLFSQYWHWSEDWLQHSLTTGMMRTPYGWQCATGITEFSERSIRNWPIQSTCADIFRLAYVWGTRHGLKLIAPVHDAVLIEAPEDRIKADVALMREIMRRASRVILNETADDTFELRTDAKSIPDPENIPYVDRFSDKRGTELWETVLKLLAERRQRIAETGEEKSA